jgi:hypothetical protein
MIASSDRRAIIWTLFWVLVIASWLLYRFGWAFQWWELSLLLLAIANVVLGVLAIRVSRIRIMACALVILGLALGQLWLWQMLFAFTTWTVNGFAP